MSDTAANTALMGEMIATKRRLEDYPDRFDPGIVLHEPASLPFGGTYHGLAEFQAFYPAVRAFYDFGRFELTGVYGDGDVVFATIRAGLADSTGTVHVAEQFRFQGRTLVEIRQHICDDGEAAARLRAGDETKA